MELRRIDSVTYLINQQIQVFSLRICNGEKIFDLIESE